MTEDEFMRLPDDTIDCPDLLPGFTAHVAELFDTGL
jgi:hypothetical protein